MSANNTGPSLNDQPTLPTHDIAQDWDSMSPRRCATSEDPISALFAAVREGNVLRVRSLLDKSACSKNRNSLVTATNRFDQTPLHVAIEHLCPGIAEIVALLIENAIDKDRYVTKICRGSTALLQACWKDTTQETHQIVEQLINAATDKDNYITTRDMADRTALHAASQQGQYQVVEQLISTATDKNGYVTLKDITDATALHFACKQTNHHVVEQLINAATDKNAYVSEIDGFGLTALQIAIQQESLQVIKHLVNAASDKKGYITATNSRGMTALHFITGRTNPDIVELLADDASDKDASNKYDFLSTQDSNGRTALHYAAEKNNAEVAERLIGMVTKKDTFITLEDDNHRTALHDAVSAKSVEAMKSILVQSTNVEYCINYAGHRGRTALHEAALQNSSKAVLFLLYSGANPSLKDADGYTAWDLICIPGKEQWEAMVAFFLTENIMVQQRNPFFRDWINTNEMTQVYMDVDGITADIMKESFRYDPKIKGRFHIISNNDIKYIRIEAGIIRQIRREFHENQEAPLYLRTREPTCVSQALDISSQIDCNLGFVSLVMPFLHVGSWSVIERRQIEDKDQPQRLMNCVSKDGIVIGRKFVETYMPITLDEYCNPALPRAILAFRNKDQVLGRYERSVLENMVPAKELDKGDKALLGELWVLVRAYARKFMSFKNLKTCQRLESQQLPGDHFPGKVVLVSQACIWIIGDEVISYNPSDVGFELSEVDWYQLRKYHPYLFITLALGKLVERFDSSGQGTDGPILRTYENALVAISEEVNQYTKNALVEEIDLDQEKALLHQISDLREELSMIKSVLATQEEVWNEYMNVVESNGKPNQQPDTDQFGATVIKRLGLQGTEREITVRQNRRSRAKLSNYNRRIAKIEQDAERVEHNILTKLELKQKHATIKEAHSTAILSATVFGFTIITVIFAPLSFVVALFALPIDKFKEGKYGEDDVFSSSYIGKWVVTTEFVSISITLLAMWAALRFADLHIWGKKGLRQSIRSKANEIRTEERQRKHAVDDVVDDTSYKHSLSYSSGSVDLEQGIDRDRSQTTRSSCMSGTSV